MRGCAKRVRRVWERKMISALDQEEEKEEKMSIKLMGLVVAVFVVAGLSCPVLAGGNMYAMTVVSSSATVGPGGTFSMDVDLSSDASDVEIQGWSYGLCHDACSFATLDSVDSADTNTVNGGNAADFDNLNLFACGQFPRSQCAGCRDHDHHGHWQLHCHLYRGQYCYLLSLRYPGISSHGNGGGVWWEFVYSYHQRCIDRMFCSAGQCVRPWRFQR